MVTAARLIPLADLVEICDGDNLPLVADLDPYRLGRLRRTMATLRATASVTPMCRGLAKT